MKLAVIGSRSFDNAKVMQAALKLHDISLLITGGARGADRLAENWAKAHRVPLRVFRANWDKHGKAAGIIRNMEMVDAADKVLAFWDGESPGTKFTINYARKQNVIVEVIPFRAGKRGQSICDVPADAGTDGQRVLP